MLQVDGIGVYYGDLQVLWDISLTVDKGEIVALIGSNGAGKTTLLETIVGLVKPKRGKVFFNDIRIDLMRTDTIVNMGITVIPEMRGIFTKMTVMENLEIGALPPRGKKDMQNMLDQVYIDFPIFQKRKKQIAGSLSGGEQQMLAIGKALMSRPLLLICDEMCLGLAPLLVKNILQMMGKIKDRFNITILIVEQNVYMSLKSADRGYIMENGRIVKSDMATVLLQDQHLKDAYFGQI